MDDEDIQSKKVRVVPEKERQEMERSDPGPDAEDLVALRRRPSSTRTTRTVKGMNANIENNERRIVRYFKFQFLSIKF